MKLENVNSVNENALLFFRTRIRKHYMLLSLIIDSKTDSTQSGTCTSPVETATYNIIHVTITFKKKIHSEKTQTMHIHVCMLKAQF